MNILIVGGGGREHALAWKVAQSPRVAKVFVAPGNAGTMREPELTTVARTAIPELVAFARDQEVALTIVGPEAPLAAGIVDAFRAAGLRIFGPTQAAAQLESSKDYAKAFMARHGIPTAQYRTFTDAGAARSLRRRARRADRRQGRRPRCRQGRRRRAERRGSARSDRRDARRQRDGCRRGAGRRRGLPRRRGGELHRHGRRPARAAARLLAGPQAAARQRSGAEHGRDGRVFAGAGDHAGDARAHHARGDRSRGQRHGRRRHPLHGIPVRRGDDRRRRQSEGPGIQLPPGRSRRRSRSCCA